MCIYYEAFKRPYKTWIVTSYGNYIKLPKESIKKLIGKELTWSDEPIELK
jgi:hypothetical protein